MLTAPNCPRESTNYERPKQAFLDILRQRTAAQIRPETWRPVRSFEAQVPSRPLSEGSLRGLNGLAGELPSNDIAGSTRTSHGECPFWYPCGELVNRHTLLPALARLAFLQTSITARLVHGKYRLAVLLVF